MNEFMETLTILREIVSDFDISDIPVKYVAAAYYEDEDHREQVVHGLDEIEKIIARSGQYRGIENVNILLDFRQIAIDIAIETNRLFGNIEKAIMDGTSESE